MSNTTASRRPPNSGKSMSNGHPGQHSVEERRKGGVLRQKDSEVMIGVYKNSRFTHGLTKLLGCKVEVQTRNGKYYEGIFKTFSGDLEVVLEYAHLLNQKNPSEIPTKDRIIEKLIVNFNDMVVMNAVDADTTYGETTMSDSFTDTGISKSQMNGSMKEGDMKELERWDDGDIGGTHLEEHSSGWTAEEMFRRNESLGVQSSYDDSLDQYTTKLSNSNTPEYRKRRAEAERHAQEIEANSSSRRNVALENGDELDEETKYSAVIRPNQQSHSTPSQSTSSNTPATKVSSDSNAPNQKYIPPHHRGPPGQGPNGAQQQFSQSARYDNRSDMSRRNHQDNRKKPSPQNTPSNKSDLNSLKQFQTNFNLVPTVNKAAESDVKPAGHEQTSPKTSPSTAAPAVKIAQGSPKPASQAIPKNVSGSPASKPAVQSCEAKITRADAGKVASSPDVKKSSAGPTIPRAAAAAAATVTADITATPVVKPASSVATASVAASAADPKPQTTPAADAKTESVVASSKLNPEAKKFTLNPNATVFQPKAPPAPAAAPPQPVAAAPAHPPQHQPSSYPTGAPVIKNKTAIVSVVDPKHPSTGRQEMPTAAQAIGPPIINSNAPPQAFYPQHVMIQPGQNQRLQRMTSFPGSDGQPAAHPQAHYVPAQPVLMVQQAAPGMHHQQMANMPPPTPPHTAAPAHLQQHPPQQAPGQPHGQPVSNTAPAQPPPPPQAVLSHPNQPNNQHIHHPNYPQQQPPPNHQGAPMQYVAYPVSSAQPNQQVPPPQPPPQPSPHNPSPSPGINTANGPMASQGYHYPPPSQQFYQPTAAGHMAGAVSQAPPYHQAPQLVYMPAPASYPAYMPAMHFPPQHMQQSYHHGTFAPP